MTSTEERQMLRDTVAALVDKHASPAAVREAMESQRGYDESLWTMLCEQVGVAALVVPEELGGAGGELADAAAVLEELGRGLVPTPLLGTTLAELALLAADEPDTDTLEQLAAGAAIGAVVFDPGYVVNGDVADVVVGSRRRLAGRGGAMSPPRRCRPWTRPAGSPASPPAPPPRSAPIPGWPTSRRSCWPPSRSAPRRAAWTSPSTTPRNACSSAGRSAASRRSSTGWPTCTSRCSRRAPSSAMRSPSPSPASAALARLAATEAFTKVAGEAIQMHGGIAITWEHDIQLYFKRAHGSAQLFGFGARPTAPARIRGALA